MTSRAQKIILAWLQFQEQKADSKRVLEWIQDKQNYVKNQDVENNPISKRERQLMDSITE